MADQTIYLTNHSTKVTDTQVQRIAAACATQVTRDCAPLNGLAPVPVVFTTRPQKGTRVIDIVDTQDDPNALGWHTADKGGVYGVSSVAPVLNNGGTIFDGSNSVSAVTSHEVLEMLCDPWCTGWADSGSGYLVAWEVGDPVQNDSYKIGDGVSVSNFVTASWFNPWGTQADRLDFMARLKRPFTLAKGGYWVQERTGKQTEKFGRLSSGFHFDPAFPAWLRDLKENGTGRSARKVNDLVMPG